MYGNVFTRAGTQIENYDFNALRRDKNGISALIVVDLQIYYPRTNESGYTLLN